MAYFNNRDRIRFAATASGTSSYTIGSPVVNFFAPSAGGMSIGDWGTFLAQSPNGSKWELFEGQLANGGLLARILVRSHTGSLVAWVSGEPIIITCLQHARRAITASQEGYINPEYIPSLVSGENAAWTGSHQLTTNRTYFTELTVPTGIRYVMVNGYSRFEMGGTGTTAVRISASLSNANDNGEIYVLQLGEYTIDFATGKFLPASFNEILLIPVKGTGLQRSKIRFFAQQFAGNSPNLYVYSYKVTGVYFSEGNGL